MDFIYFEAIVDDDFCDDEDEADFCVQKNNIDFIDDSDLSGNVCNYYVCDSKTSHVPLKMAWRISLLRVAQSLRIVMMFQIFVIILTKK